jgi:hypothetical protein
MNYDFGRMCWFVAEAHFMASSEDFVAGRIIPMEAFQDSQILRSMLQPWT